MKFVKFVIAETAKHAEKQLVQHFEADTSWGEAVAMEVFDTEEQATFELRQLRTQFKPSQYDAMVVVCVEFYIQATTVTEVPPDANS